MTKKLQAATKTAGLEAIGPWVQGISNHVYWCAQSSDVPGAIIDKWLSLLNHIANKHDNHGETFDKCLHGPLLDHHERLWLHQSK